MNEGDNPFELSPEQIATYQARQAEAAKLAKPAKKSKPEFVILPYDLLAAVALGNVQLAVLMELHHQSFKCDSANPVKLPNKNLKDVGIGHQSKMKALGALEKAGLIHIGRSGKSSPLVTLLWRPIAG
jgi:hypothetical protein